MAFIDWNTLTTTNTQFYRQKIKLYCMSLMMADVFNEINVGCMVSVHFFSVRNQFPTSIMEDVGLIMSIDNYESKKIKERNISEERSCGT